jgi:hypothetical protein
MNYKSFKNEIKEAKKVQDVDETVAYISCWGDSSTVSNFLLYDMPTFEQLCRAENEGLLTRDFDTWTIA